MNDSVTNNVDNFIKIIGVDGKQAPRLSKLPRYDVRVRCEVCARDLT